MLRRAAPFLGQPAVVGDKRHDAVLLSARFALAKSVRVKADVIRIGNELELMSLKGLGTNDVVEPVLGNDKITARRIPLNICASLPLFYRLSIKLYVKSDRFRI